MNCRKQQKITGWILTSISESPIIILNAAVRITEEQGIDKLNARNLAEKLGCSVQPIFRVYSGMEELKRAVVVKAGEIYSQCLSDSISTEDGLVGLEMAYINFAQEQSAMLYTGTFFAAHGIASMLATNHCSFQEEEIKKIMENVFEGLLLKLRSEEKGEI